MSNGGPPSAGAGQSGTGFTPQPIATPGVGAANNNTAAASTSATAPANNQNLNQIVSADFSSIHFIH
jgi:hypothetical protein